MKSTTYYNEKSINKKEKNSNSKRYYGYYDNDGIGYGGIFKKTYFYQNKLDFKK